MKYLIAILLTTQLTLFSAGCGKGSDRNDKGSSESGSSTGDSKDPARKKAEVEGPIFVFSRAGLFASITPVKLRSRQYSSFQIAFSQTRDGQTIGEKIHHDYQVQGRIWMYMPDGTSHGGGNGIVSYSTSDMTYQWSRVGFTMPGDWELTLILADSEGNRIDDATVTIAVP